jgi:hypothetical protein
MPKYIAYVTQCGDEFLVSRILKEGVVQDDYFPMDSKEERVLIYRWGMKPAFSEPRTIAKKRGMTKKILRRLFQHD